MSRLIMAVQSLDWTLVSGALATVIGLAYFIPGAVKAHKANREYVRKGRLRLDEAEQR